MLNGIFVVLILGSVVVAAFAGRMTEVNQAGIDSAKNAVTIAIGLVGMMALWLGFMRVLRDAGLMQMIAHGLAPVMRRLFPAIPPDHPAMGAMIMNMAANMLGLGNAATPFGLKAMRELDTLNSRKGVSTNAMALFLAINTSGVAVLPLGVIAIRSSLGSENAAGIFVPSILATMCSTIVAVLVARALAESTRFAPERFEAIVEDAEPASAPFQAIAGLEQAEDVAETRPPLSALRALTLGGFALLIAVAFAIHLREVAADAGTAAALREVANSWLLPLLMAAIVLFGFSYRIGVYDSFIRGAREGFDIAVMIIPYLVAILVAVGMFRASGALDALVAVVSPLTSLVGFPAEALPMALIRPLSGSGAMGVMTATMTEHGPDSFVGYLVSVMNGSTETTFYVIALYFGSVRVRAVRHTLAACLAADAAGVMAALLWSRLFY